MHDPLTVAFDVKIPLPWKRDSFLKSEGRIWDSYQLATIWHKDPERGGSDDSCGWFKRAHHGDPKVLAKIIKRLESDWDSTWTYDPEKDGCGDDGDKQKRTYCRGLLNPGGMPRFSTQGVVLNLFFIAACEHFGVNGLTMWKKARRFMQKNLFDILLFAENPVDSMFDSLNCTFGKDTSRENRINGAASTAYGWILRQEQHWWQHPRWHIHHWRFQVHFLQQLNRWLFARCYKCHRGFKLGESVYGSWSGKDIWHKQCQSVTSKPSSEPDCTCK